MTEPPPSEEPLSRRRPELNDGPLSRRRPELNVNDGPMSRRMGDSAEGPMSRRMGDSAEGPPSRRMGDSAEGPPSRRMGAEPDAPPSRRHTLPPNSEAPLSRRMSEAALLSGGPTSRRLSDPPASGPISMRSFDGPISEAPISEAPLSMRVARVSGDAGPGYRLVEDKDVIWITLDDPGAAPCRVLRLSLAAVWFIRGESFDHPLQAPVRVTLTAMGREIGPLLAQVVAIHPAEDNEPPLVGLQLIGVSLAVGRQMLDLVHTLIAARLAEPARSLAMSQEHIDAPDRIRALISMLVAGAGAGGGVLRGGDVLAKVAQFDAEQSGRIVWKSEGEWGAPPFVLDMIGYNSIHRLNFTEAHREDEGTVVTPLPTSIERVRNRWFRRVLVQSLVTVQFRHPLWPELHVQRRRVRDVSYAGMCFETDLDIDLTFPGLEIAELIIEAEGEQVIRMRGQVRFVSARKQGELSLCGMSVSPRSPVDEPRWTQLVSRELHGTMTENALAPEPVWRLFENSGYFQLSGKSPDHFEPIKASFLSFGQRAATATRLIWQSVWPSSRGVEASLSLLKAYQGTWMVHQLAKRPGKVPGNVDSRQILRDIYLRALEHPQLDPDFRWAIAQVDATVSWSRACHLEFAKRHEGTGLALVRPFRLMEGTCSERLELPASDIQIEHSTLEDEELFLQHLRKVRTAPYLEALDFTTDLFDLAGVSRSWREAGFERTRTLLVARRRWEVIAMAVVETGETGTNLFRLLDGVRLFALTPDGGDAFLQLLEAARAHYKERSKSTFIYYHEHEDDAYTEGANLRSLGEGAFWVMHALLLPDFLEHVFEITAPRKRSNASG